MTFQEWAEGLVAECSTHIHIQYENGRKPCIRFYSRWCYRDDIPDTCVEFLAYPGGCWYEIRGSCGYREREISPQKFARFARRYCAAQAQAKQTIAWEL